MTKNKRLWKKDKREVERYNKRMARRTKRSFFQWLFNCMIKEVNEDEQND